MGWLIIIIVTWNWFTAGNYNSFFSPLLQKPLNLCYWSGYIQQSITFSLYFSNISLSRAIAILHYYSSKYSYKWSIYFHKTTLSQLNILVGDTHVTELIVKLFSDIHSIASSSLITWCPPKMSILSPLQPHLIPQLLSPLPLLNNPGTLPTNPPASKHTPQ